MTILNSYYSKKIIANGSCWNKRSFNNKGLAMIKTVVYKNEFIILSIVPVTDSHIN